DHGLAERATVLLHEGARPVAVTQYNRLAYNSLDSSLRITADHNLMYFALPWETRGDGDSEPSPLGSLLAMEPDVIVEMKWYGELPHWAVDLHAYLKESTREERPSKFIVAMRWLLADPGDLPFRARRGRGQGPRPFMRRGRLHHQAVPGGGAPGAHRRRPRSGAQPAGAATRTSDRAGSRRAPRGARRDRRSCS